MLVVPAHLVEFCRDRGESGEQWLARVPGLVSDLCARWSVELDEPLQGPPGSAAWLAPGRLGDGTEVMFKLAWPHPEASTEAAGLRFFGGRGAARLLASDEATYALLLERVRPGDDLWTLDLDHANEVAAGVLEVLWRPPSSDAGSIGTLADTVAVWNGSYATTRDAYPPDLVRAATEHGDRLLDSQQTLVVVHGDFNPFNVLSAADGRWLAIDPKPLIGDPAYDLAQYLANRVEAAIATRRPAEELSRQVRFFARALDLDPTRVARWAAVKAVGWDWGPSTAALLTQVADQM